MKKIIMIMVILLLVGCEKDAKTEEKPKEENQVVYNLNEEIMIAEKYNTSGEFQMFITNFKDLFPKVKVSKNSVSYSKEGKRITEKDLEDKFDQMYFEITKEVNAKTLMNSYYANSKNLTGIKDFSYEFSKHRFKYSYNYLDFKSETYSADGTAINKAVNEAFKDAIRFNSKTPKEEKVKYKLLTEELCREYNLKCERK